MDSVPSADPIRVLVTDDDATYRHILKRTLEGLSGIEVVGAVGSIAAAKSRIDLGGIDVVTIDVVLNNESGLDLLRWIQTSHRDIKTILLTAGTVRNASSAVDALLLGASSLVLKPSGPGAPQALRDDLERVLKGMRRMVARPSAPPPRPSSKPVVSGAATRDIIAVGASTGGPPVVLNFLKKLPETFDVPIVITQHISAVHAPFLVELLAAQSGRKVVKGEHGAPVERGMAYVACDGLHMLVVRKNGRLELVQNDGPEEHNCRPAVDPMFRSVATACGRAAIGVVISGMGRDGGEGAVALRAAGAPVVIQDQATSVVWGMPGAVAALGAADAIVPGDQLADCVMRWTSNTRVRTDGAKS